MGGGLTNGVGGDNITPTGGEDEGGAEETPQTILEDPLQSTQLHRNQWTPTD